MKIRIDVDVDFNHPEFEDASPEARELRDPQTHKITSRIYTIMNEEELKNAINNMASDIEIKIENSQLKKSGYTINKIHPITIHYDKYNPTRAGKYIDLPDWIKKKKACINIKNEDDMCFKYCVQCKFYDIYKKDHPERSFHYNKVKQEDNLINWDGVMFPASNEDIDTFGQIHKESISVNVYKTDPNGTNTIIVHRVTKIQKPSCHVNLLLIENDDDNHYVLTKDYSRLMSSQTNKHKEK